MRKEEDLHATPEVWGPHFWKTIHFIALGYTAAKRDTFINFFNNLDGLIPCGTCAQNYRNHISTDLPPLATVLTQPRSSRINPLFDWTVRLHNVVNRSLGKTSPDWTPERAKHELLREGSILLSSSVLCWEGGRTVVSVVAIALLVAIVTFVAISRRDPRSHSAG